MKCSDEISIGEYVRTYNNGIKRIDTIWENKTVNKYGYEVGSEWDGKLYSIIKTTDIVKHSKEIIDLIEEGDYVNGFPVLEPVYNGNVMYGVDEGYENFKKAFGEIKSIITKEQIKQIEYRIKE